MKGSFHTTKNGETEVAVVVTGVDGTSGICVGDKSSGDDVAKEPTITNQPDNRGSEQVGVDAAADSPTSSPTESNEGNNGPSPADTTASAPVIVPKMTHLRASVVPIVQQKQPLTLSVEHLTVHVPPEQGCCDCCAPDGAQARSWAQEYMGAAVGQRDGYYALDDVSCLARTGEMVLVLSPEPGPASTFLRVVSGRANASDDWNGSILLNGIPLTQQALRPWRRLAPYVSLTDASHAAVLTVRETLLFAARCTDTGGTKTPLSTLQARVDALLEGLDLTHVADTVVGDENLRGVSGGQKRRVTIGEMLTDTAHVSCLLLDSITDGLASSDSYNLLHNLQTLAPLLKLSCIVSLQQPSDDMVQLFDQLLVLTEHGEMAYFGPLDRGMLRQVFLGSDDSDQDSGSICDLVLGPQALEDPEAVSAVIQRYHDSTAFADLVQQLALVRESAPPARERDIMELLPTDTKYSQTWWYQFRIISQRRLKLIARNAVTYTRIGIAVVFGCIIGSLFSALNNDLMGSLSRTGYIFLNCFLVLMLSAAITIPQTFRDRVTLFKHRSAEFYSGRIAYLTQVFLDIPLAVLEAVLLSSISYFWVGMRPSANYFFYFMGGLIGLEFVGQALGRLLCGISRKQVYANTLSSVVLLLFGTLGGFMPGYGEIPWVFRWLSWLTPASYAFEGLMINEFVGRNMSGVVLASPDGNIELGQVSGQSWVGTFSLPRVAYGSPHQIKSVNIAMLFILSLVLDFFGCYSVEHTRDWYFNQTRRPQSEVKSIKFQARRGKDEKEAGEQDPEKHSPPVHWPQSLAIQDLSYYVPLKRKHQPKKCSVHSILGPLLVRCSRKQKVGRESEMVRTKEHTELQLLNSVGARFEGGRMTALMGTSGAGKTTLLDVIAGYKTGGRVTGEVLIAGRPKDAKIWKQISGYAEQMDLINPYLSTLETLRFTAACRLPRDIDREAVIQDVVRLMALEDYTDMVVGREIEGEGLPKHARKRLTIAIQLVTRPRILFADEPTTGLGTAANLVMQAIRRCTDELGLITVVTIHQPSKLMWDYFNDLLLLVKGGSLAYMGEIGENSQLVLDYFSKLSGLRPSPHVNPADFVLAAVSSVSVEEVVSSFQASDMPKSIEQGMKTDKQADSKVHEESVAEVYSEASRGKSRWKEILLLTKRHLMTQWRNPSYSFMRLLASTIVSLYLGILFISDKSTISGAVFTIGSIFFLVFVLVIPMQSSVVPLIEDRAVLYRETTSGMYSRLSYGIGQLLADIPFHMLNTIMMFVCFYFIVGLQVQGDLIGYFILMLFLSNWVVTSLGEFFALAMPNEESATGIAGLAVILSVILMGFLITVSAMPSGWVWAYWTNLFHYMIQGFVTNELAENEYSLELLAPVNFTNAFVFPPGTNLTSGSEASQESAFLNLVLQAGPGINSLFNATGIAALSSLVECMVANNCLVEPISINFLTCNVANFPQPPPCENQFQRAVEAANVTAIAQCLDSEGDAMPPNSMSNSTSMSEEDGLEIVLCLLSGFLPPDVSQGINSILNMFQDLYNIAVFVLDILANGLTILVPGELILWVFGWAKWDDEDGFVAPWKWWYCMFAVAMFLVGIEILKLITVSKIVWTKR